MALRKKLLGVEHLHMYDLFAPIVDNVQTTYTYDAVSYTHLSAEVLGQFE